MGLVTCADADVLRGQVHLPLRGAWYAELKLDRATAPSGGVTVAASGGLSISGKVQRAGVFLDAAHVRIVGGAGGLGAVIPAAAYENAQLRDPLNAIMQAAGETLSSKVDSSVLGVLLPAWTNVAQRAVEAIERLCYAASQALGQSIGWRVLPDGSVWLGAETWPAQSLPNGSDLLEQYPAEGRYLIGTDAPSLLPGVTLNEIGARVAGVDHWIEPGAIRSWAWT